MYGKSLAQNKTYSQIRERNSELSNLFRLSTLIKIPGEEQYHDDCFKTVYLSSNLEYILKTYGEAGELFNFFVRALLLAFDSSLDYDLLTRSELREQVSKIMISSVAKIFEEETAQILDFFDTLYEEKKDSHHNDKAILLVPTNSIVSNSSYFKNVQHRK